MANIISLLLTVNGKRPHAPWAITPDLLPTQKSWYANQELRHSPPQKNAQSFSRFRQGLTLAPLSGMPASAQYSALPASSGSVDDDLNENEKAPISARQGNQLLLWACILAICSSIMSVAVLLKEPYSNRSQASSNAPLRRPNQYVNLDRVFKNGSHTTPFPPIMHFPSVVLQIQTKDSKRRIHEEERGWRSVLGTVYPDDRHIIVSPETSTVVQLRHIDYGMEHCILNVSVPKPAKNRDPAIRMTLPSVVDIWGLDTELELSPHILWDYAPPRRTLLGSLTVSLDKEASLPEFFCRSGEFSTLEFACPPASSENCYVDFWQNKESPYGGIYMTQFDSLFDGAL
ncbi:hypothetical protein BDQ12DRAFT_734275 [Crucibulum laeve]|uniref:Ubiquitin 3 binding protein But2 C-terminal domain-containing protein n=1 Tax=Crucibulum laeve TaxID=68775 RepID=A0A5C3M4Q1_9AGAR|nr:hypothetical protein BDQ12DRAFT_734275 [Crucibulum laeve]